MVRNELPFFKRTNQERPYEQLLITGSEVIESVKQSHNAIAHYRPSLTRNLKKTNSRPVFGISELSQYLGWRGKKDVKT